MKKLILLIVIFALVATISGCSSITSAIIIRETSNAVEEAMDEVYEEIANSIRESMDETDFENNEEISEFIRESMNDLDESDYDSTKKQKIEIWSANGEELIRTTTDNLEIMDFVKNEHIENWKYLDRLPENSQALYQIVTWQETTKTVVNPANKMIVMTRDTLYKTPDGSYYIQTHITEEITKYMPSFVPSILIDKIPEDVGQYLVGVAQGESFK